MLNRTVKKSEFAGNVLTLVTGTTIAQAIPIAVTPILTRMYTPEEFGVFALYIALVNIVSIIATSRFETAIMQPKSDSEADCLIWASFISSLIVSIVLFVIVLFFKQDIALLFKNQELENLLYLAPISVFAVSIYNTVTQWLNRKKQYRQMSINRVFQTSFMSGTTVSLGYFNASAIGFCYGHAAGFITSLLILLKSNQIPVISAFNFNKILKQIKAYKKYPLIDMPAALLNTLSNHLPVILLVSLFSSSYSGFYYLIERIFKTPINLLSNSIGSVFRQQATRDKHTTGNYKKIFLYTLNRLTILGAPIFLGLYFISPYIFSYLFGKDWTQAGEFAQILIPMFFLKFITSPLSFSFYISNKLHYDFIGQMIFMLGILASILLGYLKNDVLVSIIGISVTGSIIYFAYLIVSYNLSKIDS